MTLVQELKSIPITELPARCAELINQGKDVPASIIKRLEEYQRVLKMAEYDRAIGVSPICGVDEAGRGPLAGSVYTAAVILPENTVIEGINDSKKLSAKKRDELFEEIKEKAVSFAITTADCREIDELNIRNATYMSMNKSVSALSQIPAFVLIDGDAITGMTLPRRCVIGGDATSLSIAAASILAKVSRDRYMEKLDEKYPMYGFAKHKGYGTKEHIEAIKKYGPCPEHRMTFIKNFI